METNPVLQMIFERVEHERLLVEEGNVGWLQVDMDAADHMEPVRGPYADLVDILSGERARPVYHPPVERLKAWARQAGIETHEGPLRYQIDLTFTAPDNHFFVPSYEGPVVVAFRKARADAICSGALRREPNRLFVAPETWRALNSADEYRYHRMMGSPVPEMYGEDLLFEGMTIKPFAAKGRSFAVAYVTPESVTPHRETSRHCA